MNCIIALEAQQASTAKKSKVSKHHTIGRQKYTHNNVVVVFIVVDDVARGEGKKEADREYQLPISNIKFYLVSHG